MLQVLFAVGSERQLVEKIRFNMLFRWFVGLEIDDMVWRHSTFTKNRERLLEHDVLPAFFNAALWQARNSQLLSDEHLSVDGTLIDALASRKRFRPETRMMIPGDILLVTVNASGEVDVSRSGWL